MSEPCTYVELNEEAVKELLKECGPTCKSIAETVAKNYGKGASVRLSYATGRPHAFVNAPYDDASKDNRLLKAVRK